MSTPIVEIRHLDPATEEAYSAFYHAVPENLLFTSPAYLAYLRWLLPEAEDRTLLAMRGNEVLGALPCFVRRNETIGTVMNSLPYFGSNAGLMLSAQAPDSVAETLLRAWADLARRLDAAAWTMVENPLCPLGRFMDRARLHTLTDRRLGQLTPLSGVRADSAESDLMAMFHQKTRNVVRKAMKSELRFERDESAQGLEALFAMHQENMASVGGRSKQKEAFMGIPRFFRSDRDFRLYLARDRRGETVAGLLVFFSNRTAEYYTPAVKSSHRHLQPGSGLVFTAMQDAVARGMSWWNWGGTWLTQDGVYRFKSRWGTESRPYTYFIAIRNAELLRHSQETLQAAFPYFYVRPFAPVAPYCGDGDSSEKGTP